ncbi:hypothetical protein FQZ97_712940 [compost metagenome]
MDDSDAVERLRSSIFRVIGYLSAMRAVAMLNKPGSPSRRAVELMMASGEVQRNESPLVVPDHK